MTGQLAAIVNFVINERKTSEAYFYGQAISKNMSVSGQRARTRDM